LWRRGAFGECHAAVDKDTEVKVAVKSVFKNNKRFKQRLLDSEISVRFPQEGSPTFPPLGRLSSWMLLLPSRGFSPLCRIIRDGPCAVHSWPDDSNRMAEHEDHCPELYYTQRTWLRSAGLETTPHELENWQILTSVRHPNAVILYSHHDLDTVAFLVMEL